MEGRAHGVEEEDKVEDEGVALDDGVVERLNEACCVVHVQHMEVLELRHPPPVLCYQGILIEATRLLGMQKIGK